MTGVTRAQFMGFGMFVGELPNGDPVVYYGGQTRIPEEHKRQDDLGSLEQYTQTAIDAARAIATEAEYEPAPDAPIEMVGCFDVESGDVLLMWRVACVRRVYPEGRH